jgi:hypothetical protein
MDQGMKIVIKFRLSYSGADSDNHQIDLYDVSQALVGFQRSIALTTHLVLNGEIITQAPALKGAKIFANPAKEGSWEIIATVLAGIYYIGTAPQNTPLGHIVHSVYDYVVSQSLGVHVDYDKSIGQIVEKHKNKKGSKLKLEQHKVDSLIEKCTTAITEIHRPIFKTKTAQKAIIISELPSQQLQIGPEFDLETFAYIYEEFLEKEPIVISGRISSYNSNTYKGRIYDEDEARPIAFELGDKCRGSDSVSLITASLAVNAVKKFTSQWSTVYCLVFRNTSRSGHLKSYN